MPDAATPVLARLSFHTDLPREDFLAEFERRLAPLLDARGLVRVDVPPPRCAAPDRHSILLAFDELAAVRRTQQAWDDEWVATVEGLPGLAPVGQTGSRLEHPLFGLNLLSAPLRPSRVVEVGSGERRGQWLSLGQRDGLGRCRGGLLEDGAGNLWFGMGAGLCRFDGVSLSVFDVWDITCGLRDADDVLWFGGTGGLLRVDAAGLRVLNCHEGLPHQEVHGLAARGEGGLWVGTAGGLAGCDGTTGGLASMGSPSYSKGVLSVVEDGRGGLWLGTVVDGLQRWDGEQLVRVGTTQGIGERVAALHADADGVVWAASNKGLSRCDENAVRTFGPKDGLAALGACALGADPDGLLWIGTRAGLNRFDGRHWRTYTTVDGLEHNHINDLVVNAEGDLWLASNEGLCRFDGGHYAWFMKEEGLADSWAAWLAEGPDGTLWAADAAGLCRRVEGRFETVLEMQGATALNLDVDSQGRVWLGTTHGLYRWDDGACTRFTTEDGLACDGVAQVVVDARDRVWLASGHRGCGFTRYDGQAFTRIRVPGATDPVPETFILEGADGVVWLGTYQGLLRCEDERVEHLAPADGLPARRLGPRLQDRHGDIWFATVPDRLFEDGYREGIYRFDGSAWHLFELPVERPAYTVAMLEDRDGHLWFGTRGAGVVRWDGTAFQHLTREDGLPSNLIQHLLQDGEGDVWIATECGLVRYRRRRRPPQARVERVVGGEVQAGGDEVVVTCAPSQLVFEMTARSWSTHPASMVYLYRMEGRDDDWRPSFSRRLEVRDLEPGDYTLQVQAVDRDCNRSEPVAVAVHAIPDPRLAGLNEALAGRRPGEGFVGDSPAVRRLQAEIAAVADTDMGVLILGETGTGKGLAARMIHAASPRKAGPLIQVNCGGLPEGLVESELFGHEKGAFTGAIQRKLGKVELAAGGTLFLDEIGDLSPQAQTRLLRLLEEQEYERVGGARTLRLEARVIAATNRDLEAMVQAGRFREDLYYRLQVYPLRLPPLRERMSDVPLLATYFCERMAEHLHKEVDGLDAEALALLSGYEWPGNVRELEHAVQRAVIVARTTQVGPRDIALGGGASVGGDGALTPEEYERWYLERALEASDWVVKGKRGAAERLHMPASTLQHRMRRLGLRPPTRR